LTVFPSIFFCIAFILPSLGKPGFIASLFTLILYPLDIYVNKKTPFYLFFEKKIWIYFRLGERPPGGAGLSGGGGSLPVFRGWFGRQ
jgi:hypothetical protein